MDKFIEQLCNIKSDIIETIKPLVISEEEELEFRNATRCSICNKRFDECDENVRDAKTQNKRTTISNSSEVLSWGGYPKTKKTKKHNPRRLFGE